MAEGLTVVIPHYGQPAPTQALLEMLVGQLEPPVLQVVVVDDCSPQPFPVGSGYELVRREWNGGFAAAVNSGVDRAEHDRVLVLNSDIEVGPSFLSELLSRADPWWPAVISTRVEQDEPYCVPRIWPTVGQQVVEWLDPLARLQHRDWMARAIGNDTRGWRAEEPVVTDWATGVCLLLPTCDLRAIGGLDERYFMNCEEIDVQRRLHDERGLPVVVLPAPVVRHQGGGSSDPERRAGWLTDARMRYHHKWHGGQALRWGLVAAAVTNLGWNSARRATGRDVKPWRRFRQQIRLVDHAWRTR